MGLYLCPDHKSRHIACIFRFKSNANSSGFGHCVASTLCVHVHCFMHIAIFLFVFWVAIAPECLLLRPAQTTSFNPGSRCLMVQHTCRKGFLDWRKFEVSVAYFKTSNCSMPGMPADMRSPQLVQSNQDNKVTIVPRWHRSELLPSTLPVCFRTDCFW